MSGKPKRAGWGGPRGGSGRPQNRLADSQVRAMLSTAKKYAKLHGKTVDEILVSIIYAKDGDGDMKVTPRERIGAIKVFKEFSQPKQSEQTITVSHQEEPAISLPPLEDDPGLVVVAGGKG